MIKIIRGTFGYNNGKSIVPKTSNDEPFECDAKIEKRLVAAGVAVYVGNGKSDETKPEADEVEISRDDLIAQFKAFGLKGNPNTMKTETLKAKVEEAAKAKEAEAEEVEVETDEDAPSFDEVDGVEG